MNPYNYKRRETVEVKIGTLKMGSNNPILLQSMTNTSTTDTEGSALQIIRIADKGASLVRLTAQGNKEAENLKNIKGYLKEKGYNIPLAADIHFNPAVADTAAKIVEKVRINPGNYVDSARTFKELNYTDEEYSLEIQKIKDRFIPFLNICKENNTAIRIGVNHGSLSDRIMSKYGDTSMGMVESCMEFLRICIEENFSNVVISIKASNTVIMVYTVRLLISEMEKENMKFPVHLGVTEAGDGEDGRIKSALGIGALLYDGIGDTIRVSLSEDPENEIPVAKKLVDYIIQNENSEYINLPYDYILKTDSNKRDSIKIRNIGGDNLPVVIADLSEIGNFDLNNKNLLKPDFIYIGNNPINDNCNIPQITDYPSHNSYRLYNIDNISEIDNDNNDIKFLSITYDSLINLIDNNILKDNIVILANITNKNKHAQMRAFSVLLDKNKIKNPIIFRTEYTESIIEDLQIKSSADYGSALIDKYVDGIMICNKNINYQTLINIMFGILQASRNRMTKTEYISCPGCGRTLFDLHSTITKVKEATSHLKGLKIGIMGCIVNGPGEMADADYGYVGAGRGKISLYKNKECLEKNIPEDEAVSKLIELIKKYGDWKDK